MKHIAGCPKVALSFLCLLVGWFVCPHLSCVIQVTSLDLTSALSTGTATTSSLAWLQVQYTKEWRQRRHEADQEWKRQKQAATRDAYRMQLTENGCQESP